MKSRSVFTFAICLLLTLQAAQAQESSEGPIITDRPSFGTGAYVLPTGVFQIETGFQFTTLNSSIPGNVAPGLKFQVFNYNNTLLRYGLTDKIELRFTQNLTQSRFRLDGETTTSNPTNFLPTAIGAKVRLVEKSDELPDISFLANIGGQVFSDDGSGSFMDGTILVSGTLFNDFGLDLNFGTAWLNGLSTISYQYAFGISRGINDNLGFYLESYGILPEDGSLEEHNINGGLNFLLSNSAQLDVFGGTGFSRFSPSLFFGFGFSKRLQ